MTEWLSQEESCEILAELTEKNWQKIKEILEKAKNEGKNVHLSVASFEDNEWNIKKIL